MEILAHCPNHNIELQEILSFLVLSLDHHTIRHQSLSQALQVPYRGLNQHQQLETEAFVYDRLAEPYLEKNALTKLVEAEILLW